MTREIKREKDENDARGKPKGSMDGTGGHPSGKFCSLIWRSKMGFYSESIRFEGGGRKIRIGKEPPLMS